MVVKKKTKKEKDIGKKTFVLSVKQLLNDDEA